MGIVARPPGVNSLEGVGTRATNAGCRSPRHFEASNRRPMGSRPYLYARNPGRGVKYGKTWKAAKTTRIHSDARTGCGDSEQGSHARSTRGARTTQEGRGEEATRTPEGESRERNRKHRVLRTALEHNRTMLSESELSVRAKDQRTRNLWNWLDFVLERLRHQSRPRLADDGIRDSRSGGSRH
jgi:hypothetical protein